MTSPYKLFIASLEDISFRENHVLAPYTTYQVGGPADIMVFANNEDQVRTIVASAYKTKLPVFVLGGGSNLLISDKGIRGIVLKLQGELGKISPSENGLQIKVGAAATYPRLTKQALELGWKSALGWCGTPGVVGGALRMNAGTRLGEIADVVKEVYIVTPTGLQTLSKEQVCFTYRHTNYPPNSVIIGALLENKENNELPEVLLATATQLAHKRKATQPKIRSAGSIFKNPLPNFAGQLIEQAGLKGYQIGGAEISQVHANFIINNGNATALDILQLANYAKTKVQNQFGIELEFEIKFVGDA